MIYLDASAIVKLAHEEAHSRALADWLDERGDLTRTSSVLAEVEIMRALRRGDPAALPTAARLLAWLDLVELNQEIRSAAAAYADPSLRSLDAIHLATARFAASNGGDPLTFVAYDTRLLAAARDDGFDVATPGLALG